MRHDLRAALTVRPADTAWAFALRAGLAVAVPLVALVAIDRPAWAAVATFGAFTALYGRDEPYRRRAPIVAACGLGLIASVAAGSLAALAPHPEVAAIAAIALVGAAATLLCNRFRVGPPAGLMFGFATAVCSALPTAPGDVPRTVGLAAASAAVAWLIVMSGAVVRPAAPRRLAVARALRAAAALHTAPDGPAGLRLRHQASQAVERAWRAVGGTAAPDEQLLVAHAETELSGLHGHTAAAAAELRDLADRLAGGGRVPRPAPDPADDARIAERRLAAFLLREPPAPDAGTPRRPLWPPAARVAVGALVAGAAAGAVVHVTGLGHPYWAAVSAVAVLQAASLRLSLQRAVQRAGGTIAGLLLAGAAVALPGGPWVLVAAIVVAQVIAELLVIRNYGLAMLAVTPLALLVGELGHATPPLGLIGDRLVQTVLGCLLGLAAAALVRNRAAGRHLDEAVGAVERATAELLREPVADLGRARRLALLLGTLREAYEVAEGEPGLAPDAIDRVLRAEQAARRALTGSVRATPDPPGR